MKNLGNFLLKILLAITLITLSVGFFYLFNKFNDLSQKIDSGVSSAKSQTLTNPKETDAKEDTSKVVDICNESCRTEIARLVSQATATISAVKTGTSTTTVSSPKTSYITLGSTYTTTSADWVTMDDTGVYINLENDYGKSAKVSWEANLKVAHGNGKAFARLYDDTNKIAVDFSEIQTENNVSYKLVSSGNLPFWKGRNIYKVQLKSLNSFEVTYTGGKIRVSY